MTIYDDARNIAGEIFTEFKQGVVKYVTTQAPAGATPDDPGEPVRTAVHINSTVRPVSTKYVDGSHIVQSDRQVAMPNQGIIPDMDGSIEIDGMTHKIIEVMPRPSAGPAVVFILIVRR